MIKHPSSTRWRFNGVLVPVLLGLSGCSGVLPAGTAGSGTATVGATPLTQSSPAEPEVSIPSPGPSSEPADAVDESTSSAPNGAGLTEVRPEITYAEVSASNSSIEVSSYVPGIIESDGLCTFRVSAGTTEVTLVQPALADATTTSCGSATILLDGATAGTWTVVVEYRSPASSGASLPMTVSSRS